MTLESLMKDENFQEKLYQAADMAEVKALFSESGVEISEEELMDKLLPTGKDLSEEELENVSGGGNWLSSLRNFINALRYKSGGAGSFSGGGGGAAGGR